MRPSRPIILCALLCTLLLPAATAAAQAPTAATLQAEIAALADATARQWPPLMTAENDFANPFPADLARGNGAFVPGLLVYALHRAGVRTGDGALLGAAERAWPRVVDPVRASAFDMLGAAYAYRALPLSDARRAQLAEYMSRYGIPLNGRRCLTRPDCYSNLKLVDALAVLAITGAGVGSPDPAARLADPAAARAAAAAVVNRRVPAVIDHGVWARIARHELRGTVLSDPPADPLAYHALSTFMLGEAIAQLGDDAAPAARRAHRETLAALAALVAPDGDASYLGRGQGQTWVPALVAAAMAAGARAVVARDPVRAGGYLAVARRAVQRLAALHAGTQGFQLVPGASTRASADGIDPYAHTVAYNGLALLGLTAALDALAGIPPAAGIGRLPAEHRLRVRDERASGLALIATGRTWMAIHKTPTDSGDLRYDFGALALKRRTAGGWIDLLAPRPLTIATEGGAEGMGARGTPAPPAESGGPALLRRGRALRPHGFGIHVRGRTVIVNGGYQAASGRWIRRVQFRWTATPRGLRLGLRGAKRGDRFRLLAFTPAGTGGQGPRMLLAAGARWVFDRPIRARRLPGYHSGPIELLDALEARLVAPKSGRFFVAIGS